MVRVLHLWRGGDPALIRTVIAQQVDAGDAVTVGVLAGGPPGELPAPVAVRRVGQDLSYDDLVELVFGADHVVTW